MRKRRIFVLNGIVLLFLAAGLLTWFIWPRYYIDLQSYDKITRQIDKREEAGFFRWEIEEILGPPHELQDCGNGAIQARWVSGRIDIAVCFDGSGRADIMALNMERPESFLDKARGWLTLQGDTDDHRPFVFRKGFVYPQPE